MNLWADDRFVEDAGGTERQNGTQSFFMQNAGQRCFSLNSAWGTRHRHDQISVLVDD